MTQGEQFLQEHSTSHEGSLYMRVKSREIKVYRLAPTVAMTKGRKDYEDEEEEPEEEEPEEEEPEEDGEEDEPEED